MDCAVSCSNNGFLVATAAAPAPQTFLAVWPTKLAKDAVEAAKEEGTVVAVFEFSAGMKWLLGSREVVGKGVSCAKS